MQELTKWAIALLDAPSAIAHNNRWLEFLPWINQPLDIFILNWSISDVQMQFSRTSCFTNFNAPVTLIGYGQCNVDKRGTPERTHSY